MQLAEEIKRGSFDGLGGAAGVASAARAERAVLLTKAIKLIDRINFFIISCLS